MWSAETESPLWIRAERGVGNGRQLSLGTSKPFTHSVLVESGDSIAALQNGWLLLGMDLMKMAKFQTRCVG
jgi:hypothetical protein